MPHEALDSTDIFGYLHGSVSAPEQGEKRSDSAVELGAQGSPSSLLARVRKRQRTEDCVCVGRQGRPAAAQLHELVVQEHALGRRKPLPSILSQFSEHGLLEPGGTWYHGLGEVQGILALKEALQRGGQEVSVLGPLSQPAGSQWRELVLPNDLEILEDASGELAWWLIRPDNEKATARFFLGYAAVKAWLSPRLGSELTHSRQAYEWRVMTAAAIKRRKRKQLKDGKLQIQSNRQDPCAPQPPHFEAYPLRKEQLRSLWWMQQQEQVEAVLELTLGRLRIDPANPAAAIVDSKIGAPQARELNWQLEVALKATYRIRGGILGDAPGYGKTATTIGLIDGSAERPEMPLDQEPYFFHSAATLVLVPSNLLEQWLNEIQKFTRSGGKAALKVIAIKTVASLRAITVREMSDDAVVICSYRLLYSKIYRSRLSEMGSDMGEVRRYTRRVKEHWEGPESYKEMSFPVLEQFWWKRIVLDEFHELEAIGDTAQFESLQSLRAHFRWGLTGTPPTDVAQVVRLAKIFQLPLPSEQASAYGRELATEMCQRFLDHLARQNTSEELEAIELQEHLVPVQQAPEERAIYLQASRDVAEASDSQERLIKLCSHFGVYAGLAQVSDARSECVRIVEIKENKAKKAYREALQRASQLELHWATTTSRLLDKEEILKQLGQGTEGREGDLAELASSALSEVALLAPSQWQKMAGPRCGDFDLESTKSEMIKAVQATLCARRSLEFFRRSLLAATGEASAEQRACSICLEEDLGEEQLSITVCAHVFHSECLKEVIQRFGTCPVCRHGLVGKNKVTPLTAELNTIGRQRGSADGKAGSKLTALAAHLKQIGGEKALVFCQWEDLKKHISETLEAMGIAHYLLAGNVFQRADTLRRFQEEGGESSVRVLLLSLEHAASGANLTAANHVIFVHPMYAESAEKAVAYEAQAIARCRRYGQEKVVHCWRFVAKGTIEEEITLSHQKDLWEEHERRTGA